MKRRLSELISHPPETISRTRGIEGIDSSLRFSFILELPGKLGGLAYVGNSHR